MLCTANEVGTYSYIWCEFSLEFLLFTVTCINHRGSSRDSATMTTPAFRAMG